MVKKIVGVIVWLLVAPMWISSAFVSSKVLVKDQTSRTVAVPTYPMRIVSLAPSITEIVFDLGCGNRLVGVTRFSDYPPEAKELPKVGSYVHPDLEKIVSLRPDLCIGTKDGNPKSLINRLEAFHIPVYCVDPRNLHGVISTIEEIGCLLHADKKASAIATFMRRRIETIKTLVKLTDYRPRVFFQIGIAPIVAAGSGTYMDELIRIAGGINVAAGSIPYPRFTLEEVVAAAPEVIIITSMARGAVFQKVKAQWQKWPVIPAARTGRIYLVDSNLFDRPTPRLVQGLEILTRLIHPELFSN